MDDELRGPNGMAAKCEAVIPELIAARDAATSKAEKAELQARIRSARTVLKWCKTRAGYVAG